MTISRTVVIIALAALVLGNAPLGVDAAEGQGESLVSLAYVQGGTMSGALLGRLETLQILFSGAPSAVDLEVQDARFLQVTTRVNSTSMPGGSLRVGADREQDIQWTDIPAGALSIRWDAGDTARLMQVGGRDEFEGWNEPIVVYVRATNAKWNALHDASYPTTHHGDVYWGPGAEGPAGTNSGAATVYPRPTVAHRSLSVVGSDITVIDGPMFIRVREATLTSNGQAVVTLSPYSQRETVVADPSGTLERSRTTYTEGFLYIDKGQAWLPLDRAQLSVGDAAWTGHGEITVHGATGHYQHGERNGSFERQSVGLAGRFHVTEVVEPKEDAGDPAVRTQATGSFSIIAVDFIVESSGPIGMSLIEQAFWITLLAGAGATVLWLLQHAWAFLYVRIKEDAVLDHPRRAEIMRFVADNPGCPVMRVADDLGVPRSVARHHLMVLERAGRVRRFHEGGQTVLVPADQPKEAVLRAVALEDPRLSSIHEMVATTPVLRVELVAMLRDRHGVTGTTARRWIERAVRLGLVAEEGSGHSVTYRGAS